MIDPVEFGKAMGAIVREAVEPLIKRIEELEVRQPERGEKGDPGERGADADPIDIADVVRELAACAEIVPIMALQAAEAVTKHMEANPIRHGVDGKDGAQGIPGIAGEKGAPGRDGLDVKDLFRAEGGRLLAVLSDGTTKDLGQFVGKDGANGTDGKDGLGFEDASVELVDGSAVFKFTRGDQSKSISFPIPEFKHIGFWGPNMSAKAGEFTTHDGHLWLAKRSTSEAPSYQASDWQLAARKGADGARGKDGKDVTPREPVKLQ